MQREKKTEIITLRVAPQTKDRIRNKAQEFGLTVTDYLCLCGLGKRNRPGGWPGSGAV